jgi:DNA-binding transcriptional LysR family regulator
LIQPFLSVGLIDVEGRYLRQGSADLGLVEGQVDDPLLSVRKIDGDSLVIVVGKKHPWAGHARITPNRLTTTGWILREPGSGTRSMFETTLRRFGIKLSELRITLELPSNEAVRAAVEAGDCATASSDLVVAQSLAAATLHRVRIDLPRRAFFILRHKQRYASKAGASPAGVVGDLKAAPLRASPLRRRVHLTAASLAPTVHRQAPGCR